MRYDGTPPDAPLRRRVGARAGHALGAEPPARPAAAAFRRPRDEER